MNLDEVHIYMCKCSHSYEDVECLRIRAKVERLQLAEERCTRGECNLP